MLQENLRTLRKARGLSQEDLARQLHITRQTLSKWENGQSVPDAQLLLRLAEILDVPVSELLGGPVEAAGEDVDTVARQLERLNALLAERNRRSRRIWRVVAGVLIAAVALTALTLLLSMIAFRSYTAESAVSGETEAVVEGNNLPSYE